MNKLKLFVENFLVYGVGGIISKIIPLVMVPIITRIIPNPAIYGISDLSNTIISFGSALAVMGTYDAMYRLFFETDEEDYKTKVCSTSLLITTVTSFVVFVFMMMFRGKIAKLFYNDRKLAYLIYICGIATFVGATNSIVSAPTRMRNKRKVFLLTNTISPMVSYAISIPLLLRGHYIIALPLAGVISGLMTEIIFLMLNHNWFSIKAFDWKILKELLSMAVPLLPNLLIYWIFNSCDRVMISKILDTSAAGVYSVGAKLGSCSQLIYTAFAGGWQFFAFSTMKEKNQVENNSKVFEYLAVISMVLGIFMTSLSYFLFMLLFEGEYIQGYIVAPYLFIAPLLQMLEQVIGNQFLVIKKVWPTVLILGSGAVINILLNMILIPVINIEGAAIATMLGYLMSVCICSLALRKMRLFVYSYRTYVGIIVSIVYFFAWRLYFKERIGMSVVTAIIASYLILCLYRKELSDLKISIKENLHGVE